MSVNLKTQQKPAKIGNTMDIVSEVIEPLPLATFRLPYIWYNILEC